MPLCVFSFAIGYIAVLEPKSEAFGSDDLRIPFPIEGAGVE
jgi:hypothetical protein